MNEVALKPDRSDARLCLEMPESVTMAGMVIKKVARRLAGTRAGITSVSSGRGLGRIKHRPALVDQVVDQVRTYIIDGKFPSDGELPPEAALCEMLGVSRTVVREAMRILRAQGLIDVSQGKRPRVRPVDANVAIDGLSVMLRRSKASLHHLIELRRPLESEIAAMAALRASPAAMDEMAASIEELRVAKDLPARAAADLKFHALLADATGNPVFQLVLRTFWTLQWESRLKTIRYSSAATAIKWHDRILQAIRSRNPEQARAEMIKHIEAADADLAGAEDKGAGN